MNLASSGFGATTPELFGYSRVQRFFQIAIFPGWWGSTARFFRHAPASLYNVQETGLLPAPASINAVCDTAIFLFFLMRKFRCFSLCFYQLGCWWPATLMRQTPIAYPALRPRASQPRPKVSMPFRCPFKSSFSPFSPKCISNDGDKFHRIAVVTTGEKKR